jgi:hypothetical protein
MPKRVKITKWEPLAGPAQLTIRYAVPDPVKLCQIMLTRLQAQLLGGGCGCFTAEELIGNLKELGVEVEIQEVPGGTQNESKREIVN